MQLPERVKKYLSKQNISTWQIETDSKKLFNNIIVIPALEESKNVKRLLQSIEENDKKYLTETLLIFIVNNSEKHNLKVKEDNLKLLDYLKKHKTKNPILHIGIIDAVSENKMLPEKEGGVGFARKIGMDLSLAFFDYSNNKKKILISLDADCTVSKNYLERIVTDFNKNNYSAGYVNFEHVLPENTEEQKAIVNYEIFLRYYVLGLKYANSPYAFHTVGSTIICDYENYIKVGGMNKRKAGEDFYFMEKLAKVANINEIKSATVYPSSRISNRVPFGTGQRINRFLLGERNEYLLYSPKIFEVLKNWLDVFNNKNLTAKEYLNEAKEINIELYNFLLQQSFYNNWTKIVENSKTDIQLAKQKKIWMDGFKTLKLIHYLTDNEFPKENMFFALNYLFEKTKTINEINNKELLPPLVTQLKYLKLLKEII